MIIEYLTASKRIKDDLSSYKLENVNVSIRNLDSSHYIVKLVANGSNEDSSKTLSLINRQIKDKHKNITTLRNDCSEYFCNLLYPSISTFEWKLRKLLYMASAISKEGHAGKNIKDLDERTLGEIFRMLFIDPKFTACVGKMLKTWIKPQFTKEELLQSLRKIQEQAEKTEENNVWDQILDNDVAPTLRCRYSDIINYRNDVMHLHDIDWNTYREAWQLFKIVNSEIDVALNVAFSDKFAKYVKPDFNVILNFSLATQKAHEIIEQAAGEFSATLREIEEQENRTFEEFLFPLRKKKRNQGGADTV